MAQITKELSVDVARPNYFPALVAKQYDVSSRFLRITLRNEGVSFRAEVGATVEINISRPDGQLKPFAGTVNGDGTITVPLTGWALEQVGMLTCDVSITNADQRLTSTSFRVEVEKAAYSGADYQNEDYEEEG